MKKTILPVLVALMLSACGGGSASGEKAEEVSQEQEAEIVTAISADLEEAQEELQSVTEEGLEEIDSLLQNIE